MLLVGTYLDLDRSVDWGVACLCGRCGGCGGLGSGGLP